MTPIVIFLIIFSASCVNPRVAPPPEKIILRDGWQIYLGDLKYNEINNVPDHQWSLISINKPWQQQGHPDYYGYAWYRRKVFIPERLKSQNANDTLKISLGIIGDSDQLFLNGQLIGENSKKVPEGVFVTDDFIKINLGWFTWREYKISARSPLIHWNAENSLVVRTYSKSEAGGLKFGIPFVQMQALQEDLIFDKFKFYSIVQAARLDTVLRLYNQNKKIDFSGDLSVIAEDLVTHRIQVKHFNDISIKAKESLNLPISLLETEDSVRVRFNLVENNLKCTIIDSTTLPFVLVKK